MKTLLPSLVLLSLASFTVLACSDDDGGDGNTAGSSSVGSGGSPGTSGSGGASAGKSGAGSMPGSTAGGSTGGSSTAGNSTGGAGAGTAAGHCSPGDLLAESKNWNQKLTQCPTYDAEAGGIPDDPYLQVRQLNLPTAMTANEDYAISISVAFAMAGMQIELWGTSSSCGAAQQKLYEGPMVKGMLCTTLKPTAAYPGVFLVWRGGESNGYVSDITTCAEGVCP